MEDIEEEAGKMRCDECMEEIEEERIVRNEKGGIIKYPSYCKKCEMKIKRRF